MEERDHRQLFSWKGSQLHYADRPITKDALDRAKRVLNAHIVPKRDERGCLVALYFCIASQYSTYERPVAFAQSIRNASVEQLCDDECLREHAGRAGLLFKDRFAPSIAYAKSYRGGIEKLAEDYLGDPHNVRRKIAAEVNFLSMKTASFWYLCLGGRGLMTLDRHNFRQIAGLGIKVDKGLSHGKLRGDGRVVPLSARPDEYERIERETLTLIQGDRVLRYGRQPDGALATALFWTTGALLARRKDPRQLCLFEGTNELAFKSPFV